jgi:small subunit ribosomal protein S14
VKIDAATWIYSRRASRIAPTFDRDLELDLNHLNDNDDMGSSAFILRHVNRRAAAAEAEVQRRALLSVARNTTLPAHVRHKAQLTLSQHNGGTVNGRMNSVKNLCNETGRARGVLSKYGLCRVSRGTRDQKHAHLSPGETANTQFQFRLKATRGELAGVHSASW